MGVSTTGKICVHCKKSCANKPRIKDSHGNYYCKSCHEEAEGLLKSHKARKADSQKVAPDPKPVEEPMTIALAGEDDDDDQYLALDDSFVPIEEKEHDHDHGDLLEPGASSEPEAQNKKVLDLDINLSDDSDAGHDDTDDMLLMDTDNEAPLNLD